jgi:hypothetical protein
MGKLFSMHGSEKNARRVQVGKPDEKGPLRRKDVGERMILKWIGLFWLRIETSGRLQ